MVLEPMADLSEMVTEAAQKPENARFKTGGVTAGEWFARRIKNQRTRNQKVNVDFSRIALDIHHQARPGTGDVDGKPGNGAYSISMLRRANCSDMRLNLP